MKNWIMGLALLLPSLLRADIIETNNIEDVYPHVEEGTIVFLGMTDTISDSVLSLGSKPWRHYIRRNVRKIQELDEAGNLHDQWTFYVAASIPVKPVQKEIVEWIDTLQKNNTPVFCLTGRGRSVWYATVVDQVDNFTDFQLKSMGIDLKKSKVPEELQKADPQLFHNGVFYTDPYTKGGFIDKILQETGYQPKKIVVVDDQWHQLQSVEEKLTEAGIPHVCVLYQRAEKERKNFNPVIALLQLESLFEKGIPLYEDEAVEKAKTETTTADELFKKLVDKYGNLN
ncbi:MAG TPA: DUF2608 domain-containing protein [Rhabdochlamydiaceae bacterium]